MNYISIYTIKYKYKALQSSVVTRNSVLYIDLATSHFALVATLSLMNFLLKV